MKLLTALAAALVLNFGAINSMDAAASQEKGSNIMATEDFSTVFARGEKNDAYAQYFVGQSYLNMLSLEQVVIGNVTF